MVTKFFSFTVSRILNCERQAADGISHTIYTLFTYLTRLCTCRILRSNTGRQKGPHSHTHFPLLLPHYHHSCWTNFTRDSKINVEKTGSLRAVSAITLRIMCRIIPSASSTTSACTTLYTCHLPKLP